MEVVRTFIQNLGSNLLAILSLIIAIISLVQSIKAQKLQNRVNEIELKIKKYEIGKIENEKAQAKFSCVEARIIKISKNNYKIKIWNSGKVDVTNVEARLDGVQTQLFAEDKLPYQELAVGKSFEIPIMVYMGMATQFRVITSWIDPEGHQQEKNQVVSIP